MVYHIPGTMVVLLYIKRVPRPIVAAVALSVPSQDVLRAYNVPIYIYNTHEDVSRRLSIFYIYLFGHHLHSFYPSVDVYCYLSY